MPKNKNKNNNDNNSKFWKQDWKTLLTFIYALDDEEMCSSSLWQEMSIDGVTSSWYEKKLILHE
jgi:hypothetical protein